MKETHKGAHRWQARTVDDRNPASPNIPGVLVHFGMYNHAGFLSSTVGETPQRLPKAP